MNCRLVLHEQSNINPNSSCSYTYSYYWWILCLNAIAWFGAQLILCHLYRKSAFSYRQHVY